MEKFSPEELQRIGNRIRELRKKKHMSQAELSEKTHIALPRISPIELGKNEMFISTLVRIAEALDVSTDMILRPNTPEVNSVYQTEFQDLLGDCTPDEIDSILKIVNMSKKSHEITLLSRILAAQKHPVGIYFISEDIFTLSSYYLDDLGDASFLPSPDWELLPDDDEERLMTDGR